jgi:hypothetical protein
MNVHSATCSCYVELYKQWSTFADFFPTPAVAMLNYISSGILLRIFSQTGIFAGFSLHIINFAVRISEAATDRGQEGEILKRECVKRLLIV